MWCMPLRIVPNFLRFTSPEYSEEETTDDESSKSQVKLLDPTKCKAALSMVRRIRWFSHKVCIINLRLPGKNNNQ